MSDLRTKITEAINHPSIQKKIADAGLTDDMRQVTEIVLAHRSPLMAAYDETAKIGSALPGQVVNEGRTIDLSKAGDAMHSFTIAIRQATIAYEREQAASVKSEGATAPGLDLATGMA
jgi:hypothetical protein